VTFSDFSDPVSSFGYLAPKTFEIILFSNLSTLSVSDEGHPETRHAHYI
jgi:hypothetical protein